MCCFFPLSEQGSFVQETAEWPVIALNSCKTPVTSCRWFLTPSSINKVTKGFRAPNENSVPALSGVTRSKRKENLPRRLAFSCKQVLRPSCWDWHKTFYEIQAGEGDERESLKARAGDTSCLFSTSFLNSQVFVSVPWLLECQNQRASENPTDHEPTSVLFEGAVRYFPLLSSPVICSQLSPLKLNEELKGHWEIQLNWSSFLWSPYTGAPTGLRKSAVQLGLQQQTPLWQLI